MPPRFREGFADEVSRATDLVDLAGQYTRLVQRGREWTGCCPFHSEKTPSFWVNPEKGLYYCFGCNAKGNVLQFVMTKERLDFAEAVAWLARRANIPLAVAEKENTDPRPTPLSTLTLAQKFYAKVLAGHPSAEPARAYLQKRGITDREVRHFGLGFAPPHYSALKDYLLKKGVPLDVAMEAGVVDGREGRKPVDMFRGRLLFPVHNARGQVVGFGGRLLGEELKIVNAPQAKYYNSPENVFFKKGDILFHLHHAGRAAKRTGQVVLAEGYMDVMAFHRANITEAVAGMGTALTDKQIALLAAVAPRTVLAYDQDNAGQTALHKSAVALLQKGANVHVLSLEEGKDPDEYLSLKGPQALAHRVAMAEPYFFYRLKTFLVSPQGQDPLTQLNQQKEMLALLGLSKDQTLQAAVIKEMARLMPHADERTLNRLFFKGLGEKRQRQAQEAGAPVKRKKLPPYREEGLLLGCAIQDPALLASLKDLDSELFRDEYYKKIFLSLAQIKDFEELNNLVAQTLSEEENPCPVFVRRVRADRDTLFSEALFNDSLNALVNHFERGSMAKALEQAFQQKASQQTGTTSP